MTDKVQNIVISKINILNPRERNKQIAGEIKKNIEDVGLKRPITVTRKPVLVDGYEYDLVCKDGLKRILPMNKPQFRLWLLM